MMNIQGLMKQAQMVQKRMRETQERLASEERTGTSGGGLVSVVLNGQHEMKSMHIDVSLLKDGDSEMLEDLITAAYHDAHRQIEQMQEDGLKEASGGINFGGLKIPF